MNYKVIKEFPKSGNEMFNSILTKGNIIAEQYNNSIEPLGIKTPGYIKIVTPANTDENSRYSIQPPHSFTLNLETLERTGYLEKV